METVYSDDILFAKLKRVFGKLWIVLELTGIFVFEKKNVSKMSRCSLILLEFCFPAFLHCNLFYLWYCIITNGKLNYELIIDITIPLLSIILWWLIYVRRNLLKNYYAHMISVTVVIKESQRRTLSYLINISLIFVVIYYIFFTGVQVIQGNVLVATTLLYFRTAQEIILPSVVAILYCSNCYFLLLGLRSIKSKLEQQPDMCSEGVRKICKLYFSVIQGIEKFEDLFSTPVFILVANNFCLVSLIVMDMLYVRDWISKLMVEAVFYCLYVFASLGVLTICAANIPLEMQRIKSVLLNKMSASSFEGGLLGNEKCIELLLKRDVFILTSCNVFQFDRGFLLKALVTVVAQAIVVSQLVHSVQIISSSEEESSLIKQPENF
ncbi:uncharacterized protein TNIN_118821 [Trichonephila inaurata madagascariensis]|uniref:Uncharacterized protein n=1 Tax=Trichonephila inaurata madagascariensis TaxID=2747483 RepID=A0A8X6Y4I5_9ARAC|nr:uncharacterized protein TNIN_118821 [Trichonephila inaurata madagascariensis]